ncbi:MAG: aspartate/glutamate racemase family protein [Rhodoferax sp.]
MHPLPSNHLRTRAVGILGGMGPAAGADLLQLFLQACTERLQQTGHAVNDQAFPEHWLAQIPAPDRTQALRAASNAPLEPMAAALRKLQSLGVCAVAIGCNTAHAWHTALQARIPEIELLHMPREVASRLQTRGVGEVALLATQGTYQTGLYETALSQAGLTCHLPQEAEREILMQGIYAGVKTGDMALAQICFVEVAQQLLARHGAIPLIMACTEIPLALPQAAQAASWTLINPAQVLAQALASRAYSA